VEQFSGNALTDNVFHQAPSVCRAARERLNGHRALVIWFTGLSGAGKTTLANALEAELHRQGRRTLVLDGDNVTQGLCADLGFLVQDRHENLRRVAEMARMTVEAGVVTLAAFISPLAEDRAMVRSIVGAASLFEVYVRCPLDVCETRDVKGLYKKVRRGEIDNFTGISAPYDAPDSADLVLDTGVMPAAACVAILLQRLQSRMALP
jgi:adenylylsulfate kinase